MCADCVPAHVHVHVHARSCDVALQLLMACMCTRMRVRVADAAPYVRVCMVCMFNIGVGRHGRRCRSSWWPRMACCLSWARYS
jgi:hypothetical protein